MKFEKLRFHPKLDDKIFMTLIAVLVIYAIVQSITATQYYYLGFLSNVLIFGIFALAYNLLHGYTGLLSFGHAGFFIIGAYGGALAMSNASNNVWLGFLGSLGISAAFAFVTGFFSVRSRGIYFALLTLAFGMLPFLAINSPLRRLTGGSMGWHLIYAPPFFFDLSNKLLFFLFTVGISIAVYVILRIMINSPFGQSLKGIRDNELKLEGLGYNTRRLKYTAVTISGAISGVAGYLYLLLNLSISPSIGGYFISAKVIFVSLIGGVSGLVGPLLGTFVWFLIDEFLVAPGFLELTLGITLAVVILRFPGGIMGIFKK